MVWHRGQLAGAERLAQTATLAWHGSLNLMGAAGFEFLNVLAAARERVSDGRSRRGRAEAAGQQLVPAAGFPS
jgi:hypothetical protein